MLIHRQENFMQIQFSNGLISSLKKDIEKTPNFKMKAVISIHDCMPETMDKIQRILKWLKERNIPPVTLLVVPGKNWKKII